MKKFLISILFVLCTPLLYAQSNDSLVIDIVLIGGQSNATGQGYIKNIPHSFKPDTTVLLYFSKYLNKGKQSEQWVPLRQASESADRFGVELSLGTILHQKYPNRKVALIKHALSGSNLYRQWNPGNRPQEKQGEEYAKFIRTVRSALNDLRSNHYKPVIRAMVWQQGEADARYDAGMKNTLSYGKNLKNFIQQIRKEFSTPDMLFVYGSVMPMKAERFTGRESVREAQKQVAEESHTDLSEKNAIWIHADDLQMLYTDFNTPSPKDDVHLGTFGVLELGKRFANTIYKHYSTK